MFLVFHLTTVLLFILIYQLNSLYYLLPFSKEKRINQINKSLLMNYIWRHI